MIRKKSVDVIHKNFLNFNKASKKIHKNSTKDFPSNKIFYLPHGTNTGSENSWMINK